MSPQSDTSSAGGDADDAVELLPAEDIALTVAVAHLRRGEAPSDNVAVMCTLALARLAGRYDWTEEASDE